MWIENTCQPQDFTWLPINCSPSSVSSLRASPLLLTYGKVGTLSRTLVCWLCTLKLPFSLLIALQTSLIANSPWAHMCTRHKHLKSSHEGMKA